MSNVGWFLITICDKEIILFGSAGDAVNEAKLILGSCDKGDIFELSSDGKSKICQRIDLEDIAFQLWKDSCQSCEFQLCDCVLCSHEEYHACKSQYSIKSGKVYFAEILWTALGKGKLRKERKHNPLPRTKVT